MLNLGMTEIFIFAIIALVVLGPDKLPEAARFAGKWYGKIKRMISNVQNDIDRELRMSELREQMQQELDRIKLLEQKMQTQLDQIQDTQQLITDTKKNQNIYYMKIQSDQPKYRPNIPFLDPKISSLCSHSIKDFKAAI